MSDTKPLRRYIYLAYALVLLAFGVLFEWLPGGAGWAIVLWFGGVILLGACVLLWKEMGFSNS